MKKFLSVVLLIALALSLSACQVAGANEGDPPTTDWMTPLMLVVAVIGIGWMWLRSNKQKKKEQQQKASMEVGDGVMTIGGVIGRVVSIKDDVFVLETSSDRTRIRFHKSAIQSIEKLKTEE